MSTKKYNIILIVDDDSTSTFLIKTALEDMQIAQHILTATNGREGVEQIQQHCLHQQQTEQVCPDLILLDINMPVMDGFEMLDELQNIGQKHLIQNKIVVLTSSDNPGDKAKMLSLGVKEFVTKPLTEEKLTLLMAHNG